MVKKNVDKRFDLICIYLGDAMEFIKIMGCFLIKIKERIKGKRKSIVIFFFFFYNVVKLKEMVTKSNVGF